MEITIDHIEEQVNNYIKNGESIAEYDRINMLINDKKNALDTILNSLDDEIENSNISYSKAVKNLEDDNKDNDLESLVKKYFTFKNSLNVVRHSMESEKMKVTIIDKQKLN